MRRTAAAAGAVLLVLVAPACGTSHSSTPKADPRQVAQNVLDLIVHNRYTQAWSSLHPSDQAVAPRGEYVNCESRSPVIAVPTSVKVVAVRDESVGIGDGSFLESKAVDLRLGFTGGFHVVQTVHLVAANGQWRWILPPAKYREYKADTCPTDASTPAPTPS